MAYLSPFTSDEEVLRASTHDIVFTFSLLRETESPDKSRLCVPLVDRQLTGKRRGWMALLASNGNLCHNSSESMLLHKYWRVCPSIIFVLGVVAVEQNGINLVLVCFMHLQNCEEDVQAASAQQVKDSKYGWLLPEKRFRRKMR